MHQDADNGYGEAPAEEGEKKAPGDLVNAQPNITTEQVVGPVSHIHDVHHPENEGKATGQKEKDGCEGNTTEGLNDEKVHGLSPFTRQEVF